MRRAKYAAAQKNALSLNILIISQLWDFEIISSVAIKLFLIIKSAYGHCGEMFHFQRNKH